MSRSSPAQNTLCALPTTTARTSGSACASARASSNSSTNGSVIAFTGGRSSVISATRSRTSYRMNSRSMAADSCLSEGDPNLSERAEVCSMFLSRTGELHAGARSRANDIACVQSDTGSGEGVGEPGQRHQRMIDRVAGGAAPLFDAIHGEDHGLEGDVPVPPVLDRRSEDERARSAAVGEDGWKRREVLVVHEPALRHFDAGMDRCDSGFDFFPAVGRVAGWEARGEPHDIFA